MNNNNIHLIPQIVIDCAEGLSNAKHEHTRTAYELRLEAIRDYCDNILNRAKINPPVHRPSTKVFSKKNTRK